jgi:hypothetical protein
MFAALHWDDTTIPDFCPAKSPKLSIAARLPFTEQ